MTVYIKNSAKSVIYAVTVITRKSAVCANCRTAERFAMNTYPIYAKRLPGHHMFAMDAIVFTNAKNLIFFTELMFQMISIYHY